MGGVKGTRYLLPLHFCNIRTQKMSKFKICKVIKNNFRILKKPHAYLQTILKAPVKFQKDQLKTVVGVTGTRYLLLIRFCSIRTGKGRGGCFYFFCFFTFIPVPLSSLSLSFISSTISSIFFLPFSGRRHKMTHKG